MVPAQATVPMTNVMSGDFDVRSRLPLCVRLLGALLHLSPDLTPGLLAAALAANVAGLLSAWPNALLPSG
jgi:hypothetical protein